MQIDGWKYYNHAAVPTTAPHEEPDMAPIKDGSIWKLGGRRAPLLARWTADFDCDCETNWWYVMKDSPFDIQALKAKRRYEINKGNKNFLTREIVPAEWCEEIYKVTTEAYTAYPEAHRPKMDHDRFVSEVRRWNYYKVYGAFSMNDGELCGYACLIRKGSYIDFCVLKAVPTCERLGLNAAIVNHVLVDHQEFLNSGGYICDGARSIQHETAFQDYLQKYFGFRKAYCTLHVIYRPAVCIIVKMLYPFRKLIKRFSGIGAMQKIIALLQMEAIKRSEI